jgi:hypothetical protein
VVWVLRRMRIESHFSQWAAWGMGSVAAFWVIDRTLLLL